MIGKGHKQAIVSLVERKSGYAVLAKVKNKTADLVSNAIIDRLKPLATKVKTLTYDNGKEFALHQVIASKLGATVYFARPYHSWERGLNEHTNGLVRQYLPKHKRLDVIDNEIVKEIEQKILDLSIDFQKLKLE